MSPEERETIVNFDYFGKKVAVWTTQRGLMARFKRAGWHVVSEARSKRGSLIGMEFESSIRNLTLRVKKEGSGKARVGFALKARNGAETEGK